MMQEEYTQLYEQLKEEILNEFKNEFKKILEEGTKIKNIENKEAKRKPKYGKFYYYVDVRDKVVSIRWTNEPLDNEIFKNTIIFKSESEAQNYAAYRRAKRANIYEPKAALIELRKDEPVYYIYYDFKMKTLGFNSTYSYPDAGTMYFETGKKAQDFILEYKKEILRYEFGMED